jgi:hypothetical protein
MYNMPPPNAYGGEHDRSRGRRWRYDPQVLSIGKVRKERHALSRIKDSGGAATDGRSRPRVSEFTLQVGLDSLSVSLMDAANFHELVVLTLERIQVRLAPNPSLPYLTRC